MRKISTLIVVLAVIFLAGTGWAFDLTILHVNDSHSYLDATEGKLTPDGTKTEVQLGAWARLTAAMESARRQNENTALLHAGDAVQGGLYFMKYGGKPEMEFLTRLKFDAMTLGNHEFDKGADYLAGFLEYTDVPILGANINASGVPKLAKQLKPYTILSFGDERVGVIGLTTKDTQFVSSPGPGVIFADEAETARTYIKELEEQGVDKIILLTHVGLGHDKKLAAEVAGVDVIVGGHSHSLLADPDAMQAMGESVDGTYPVVVKGVDGNDVYVVTSWKWGRVLGRLNISFDESGNVTAATGTPVLLVADDFKRKDEAGNWSPVTGEVRQKILDDFAQSSVANVVVEDAAAAAFLAPFSDGVQSMRTDAIGVAAKSLPNIRVPGVTGSGISLPHGSLIAPLVARSMLEKFDTTGIGADMALQNAGGVRDGVNRGNITVGTAYMLLPFGNTLCVLDATGQQIKSALEYGVTRGRGAFPYVAGARYTADMNQPEGHRVTSVDMLNAAGKWEPLEMARTYRLVTNSYLARGGDGYDMFKSISKRYDTGFVDAQAFIEFVKKQKIVAPPKSTGVTYVPAKP